MKKVILISLVFASTYLNGQDSDIATEVLDSLYSQAIDGRIDLMLQGGPIFFEQNEVTARIGNIRHFSFLNDRELIQKSLDSKM